MNKYLLIFLLIFSVQSLAQDSLEPDIKTGNLIVRIIGFENSEGNARVALCNSDEDWDSEGEAFRGLTSKVVVDSAVVTFENIPYGNYGIKVHHDEDEDCCADRLFTSRPHHLAGLAANLIHKFSRRRLALFLFGHRSLSLLSSEQLHCSSANVFQVGFLAAPNKVREGLLSDSNVGRREGI